jgi:hypothetical protein
VSTLLLCYPRTFIYCGGWIYLIALWEVYGA